MLNLSIVAVFLAGSRLCATDWYVAPNGNDAWSGQLPAPNANGTDGPFATLAKARDVIRPLPGARTVHLRAGLYELPQGLKFGAEDSGRDYAPVVWQAYENEKPILIGGRAISNWKPWKDGILQADVGAQGFKDVAFKQLLFDGQRQVLARYPNFDPENPYGGGWAYVDGEMWPMYADKEGEDRHTLLVKTQDWRAWAKPEEVEVFVFPRYNWWNDILRVKFVDAEKRTITTAKDGSYAMRANDRYYFQGALEELDAPGEWYLDRASGTVYFKPPRTIESAKVYAPTTREILHFEGTDFLTLRGLTFECSEGTAIVFSKSSHCRVVGCTIRNVGDFSGGGVSANGGADVGIVGCDISNTGNTAVSLGGGVFYKQGVGVGLSGVALKATTLSARASGFFHAMMLR